VLRSATRAPSRRHKTGDPWPATTAPRLQPRADVSLPVELSPYLRPFRRGGALWIDDGCGGELAPSPVQAAVLAALWPGHVDRARLSQAALDHGASEVKTALGELVDLRLLHADRAACDAARDAALERQRPVVPFVDQIELTSHCPMRCGFCPRGIPGRMQRASGFMERALFVRLLDQLNPEQARWRALELHHLGESLLHPELPALVAEASARGLPTEMSANPSHLTPELGRALLDAGLSRLVMSLDGMDAVTLATIRGPAARFERAERNLEALLEHAAALPAPPTIVIQMIDLARNRHQHAAFLARWATTGLGFVRAYVKDLDGPDPDTGAASARPTRYLCGYPWRSVVVLWDGRVVPCCRDDDARLVLGDLNRQTLGEIWNGPAAHALRELHRRGDAPAGHLCTGCAWRRDAFAAAAPARHPDHARDEPLHW
jgi:radical SAM protein with 4Fe4S-binding SPASM domain